MRQSSATAAQPAWPACDVASTRFAHAWPLLVGQRQPKHRRARAGRNGNAVLELRVFGLKLFDARLKSKDVAVIMGQGRQSRLHGHRRLGCGCVACGRRSRAHALALKKMIGERPLIRGSCNRVQNKLNPTPPPPQSGATSVLKLHALAVLACKKTVGYVQNCTRVCVISHLRTCMVTSSRDVQRSQQEDL